MVREEMYVIKNILKDEPKEDILSHTLSAFGDHFFYAQEKNVQVYL